MINFFSAGLFLLIMLFIKPPEVKIAGAMKNIMVNGDLSSHMSLDTIDKTHLYGLGPVAGLKGEIMIVDGKIYSSSKHDDKLINKENNTLQAAMLVYSRVDEWMNIPVKATVKSYGDLEKLVENTAKTNGYDIEIPFAFKIEISGANLNYHIIDWKEGTTHTMDNHKQFAYSGRFKDQKVTMLGFYSTHHQSIFTHHTTNMHLHVMDDKTKTVGHLDDIQAASSITIYLPLK